MQPARGAYDWTSVVIAYGDEAGCNGAIELRSARCKMKSMPVRVQGKEAWKLNFAACRTMIQTEALQSYKQLLVGSCALVLHSQTGYPN